MPRTHHIDSDLLGKRVAVPRCPNCRASMELSGASVMLPDGVQAEPPVWLCRRCWMVLPVKGKRLDLMRADSRETSRRKGASN